MLEWINQAAKKRLHLSSREFQMILVVSIPFMIGALTFVWSNTRLVKQSYEYQALMKERRNLLRDNHLLTVEAESLKSLDRVQQLARKKIGLEYPKNNQVVTVFLN